MTGNTLILDAFWVDNKPFPTVQSHNTCIGKAFHDYYSGNARYLGWMDLVLLKELIKKAHISHIILPNIGALGKILKIATELKVCTAYEYKHLIFHTIKNEKDFPHYTPIYTTVSFGGWDFSEDDKKLPIRAESYMRYLLIHTHVDSIVCMNRKIKVTAHWNELGNVVFDTVPNL